MGATSGIHGKNHAYARGDALNKIDQSYPFPLANWRRILSEDLRTALQWAKSLLDILVPRGNNTSVMGQLALVQP